MNTDLLSQLLGRPVSLSPLPLTAQYPQNALMVEMIKAGTGSAACLFILLLLQPSPYLGWPFAGLGLLFLTYFVNQAKRIHQKFKITSLGISRISGKKERTLTWEALEDFQLSYYPHGRNARTGNFVLKLRGNGMSLKVESSLDHFSTLLATATIPARNRELILSPATLANLEQLGL